MRSFLDELLNIHSRPIPEGHAKLALPEGDPYAGVPLLLQLVCGCEAGKRNFERVIDDVAAALRRDRKQVEGILLDQPDERIPLLDDLRFLAVREDSQVLHDLADRVMWTCLRDRPDTSLVDRLAVRLTPHLAHVQDLGWITPLRRAAQIASARLTLIHILLADRSGDSRSQALANLNWTADRLVRAAATATAILDEEIESAQHDAVIAENAGDVTRSDPDLDLDVAIPDYRTKEKAAEGEGDEDTDFVEEEAKGTETILVLPRLPLATNGEAKKTIEPFKSFVGRRLPLVPTPDLAAVRESLISDMPHLEGVIDAILMPLATRSWVSIPPTLLVGNPGCGKTTLAQALMQRLGVPYAVYDAAGQSDPMMLGSSRKWHGAAPGLPLELISQHKIGNVGIIVDEIEKLGGSTHNGDTRLMLLGLFEPRRSETFLDRFLEVPVNYSALNWLATANTTTGVPGALLNRMRVLRCPSPEVEHVDVLAPQLMKTIMEARGLDERWAEPLSQLEIDALRRHWRGGSIRNLRRLIEGVLAARDVDTVFS